MSTLTAKIQPVFHKTSDEIGSGYWAASEVSPAALRELCLKFDRNLPLTKQADIGGEQESGFEQSFSSLAYAYLRDKAPRLLDFIVGFQLVERNADSTKACGIFGFRVNKLWLFAPVFFLQGALKGHELLYIKGQDLFCPLKENWVNYITGKQTHTLGEGSPRDSFQLGGLAPNIETMSFPPLNSKWGSDLGIDVAEWAQPFLPVLAACATKSAKFIWRDQPAESKFDISKLASAPLAAAFMRAPVLEDFLKVDWRLAKAAYDVMRRYPAIKIGFDNFHGEDFFTKLAEYHQQTNEAAAFNVMPAPAIKQASEPQYVGYSLLPAVEKRAVGDNKVTIITSPDAATAVNLPPLKGDEKTELLSKGYLVKDMRTGEEKTRVYNTQVRQELMTPHETSIYEVLEAPAEFSRMLVITNPQSNSGACDFVVAVRLGDGAKAWVNIHRNRLFARRVELQEDFRKWFDGLSDSTELEKGAHYVAISGRGEGSVPFSVRGRHTGDKNRYHVSFDSHADYRRGKPGWVPMTQNDTRNPYSSIDGPKEPDCSSYNALLVLNERPESKLRAISCELHVPTKTFKFLKLKDPPKPKKNDDKGSLLYREEATSSDGESCCGHCGSDPKPIAPGSLEDIQILFSEKTASLRLRGDGPEVTISSSKLGDTRLRFKEAMFHLIATHGCDENAATEMLKEAKDRGEQSLAVEYRVKYADPYPLPGPGPTSPPIPAPLYGTEPIGYNNVNAIYPQTENIPIPGLDSSRTDPKIYDPFLRITPDQNAVGFAQQAAQSGQKEVFDTSMMTGLLKSVRQDSLVNRYLGDLMKALDCLGRLLFVFYWHQDDFSDRYSKHDLPELEDSLRNTFESLGDLVLFLREKEVEPGFDQQSGPDIEDAASN